MEEPPQYPIPYIASTFVRNSTTGPPIAFGDNSITLKLDNDDIAFVLGKKGHTKQKLARVSGARLEIDEDKHTLLITGSLEERTKAQEYVDMVLGQRKGSVQVDLTQKRDDLTILQVPEDCVGYVTGRQGKALRNLEDEWATLMFFTNAEGDKPKHENGENNPNETETLVIFGKRRGRVGATLKVMSSVEHKRKGYFVQNGRFVGDLSLDLESPDGFFIDQTVLSEADFSYALGSEGKTRKKLARASGCILEYVGSIAIMIGEKEERERAQIYLKWLLLQRQNGKCIVDVEGRNDVDVVHLESKYVGWVTGMKGKNLRKIEEDTGVYLFANSEDKPNGEKDERIMIFSCDPEARRKAKDYIEKSIDEKRSADAGGYTLGRGRYLDRGGGDPKRMRGEDRRGRSPPQRGRSPRGRRAESPRNRRESPGVGRRRHSPSPPRRRRGDSRPPRDDFRRGARADDRGIQRGRNRSQRR